jgi:hypothetical protein
VRHVTSPCVDVYRAPCLIDFSPLGTRSPPIPAQKNPPVLESERAEQVCEWRRLKPAVKRQPLAHRIDAFGAQLNSNSQKPANGRRFDLAQRAKLTRAYDSIGNAQNGYRAVIERTPKHREAARRSRA